MFKVFGKQHMVDNTSPNVKQPRFKSSLCYSLAVGTQAIYQTSLSLSFLICETGRTVPSSVKQEYLLCMITVGLSKINKIHLVYWLEHQDSINVSYYYKTTELLLKEIKESELKFWSQVQLPPNSRILSMIIPTDHDLVSD